MRGAEAVVVGAMAGVPPIEAAGHIAGVPLIEVAMAAPLIEAAMVAPLIERGYGGAYYGRPYYGYGYGRATTTAARQRPAQSAWQPVPSLAARLPSNRRRLRGAQQLGVVLHEPLQILQPGDRDVSRQ